MLVEADEICGGITGNTTAKITLGHGLIYDKMIKRFGEDKARLYVEAQSKAIKEYAKICIVVKCTTNKERRFMKLTKEQTQEILKTIDKVERQTEDFTLTLRRARRAIEMNDQSATELLLAAYEQKERSTLLCRALPIYSPEPQLRPKVKQVLIDAACARCGYTEEGWFCAVIPTLLSERICAIPYCAIPKICFVTLIDYNGNANN